MRLAKKTLCLLLTMFVVVGLFSSIHVDAEEIALPIPTIKVKTINKGTGVKVTISKTKDANGFEVFAYGSGTAYSEYKNVSDDYQKVAEVTKNGNAKRTVTIKSLPAGSYKIKVRSYTSKKYGTITYSDFSKEKSVKVKKAANGYKDSYDFSKVKKGDVIKFGSYEQDNDFSNGKEPIEWIVLEKTDKQVFVVSKYALDGLPYNKQKEDIFITWEDCTLRKWLNDKFYTNAFNKIEKGMIKTTTVKNYNNPLFETVGGNNTKDKVFLLSYYDILNSKYGFEEIDVIEDMNRRCAPTAYAIAQGVFANSNYKTSDGELACDWWLRSPGSIAFNACYVNSIGRMYPDGAFVGNIHNLGVRPAMWINIKS